MPIPKKRFTKILVGVDLSDEDRFVGEELASVSDHAIERAVWLAEANSAQLCFLYVLPPHAAQLSFDTQMLLTEGEDYKTVFDDAKNVLADIAASASKSGVETSSKVVFGTTWIEMMREVLREQHEFVVVGTRKKGAFRSMLFGRTSIKLLRKCPCPVWATKPQAARTVSPILVAHDLTDVGQAALELGCWIAREQGAALHVLHAIERKQLNDTNLTVESADQKLRDQLARLDVVDDTAQIHIVVEPPEQAILSCVEKQDIQLLVMGTIARTGIAGLIVGNTAEKLLPFLPCSVLAIKPEGFKSPVTLGNDESKDDFV